MVRLAKAIIMRRRDFITLLGGAAAAWPLAARAQQTATPVIGYLGLTTAQSSAYMLASFRKGLSELGFEDGRNVTLDRPVVGAKLLKPISSGSPGGRKTVSSAGISVMLVRNATIMPRPASKPSSDSPL